MNKTLTRNRYFQVLIRLGISRIKFDLMDIESLVKLLVVSGFLTQVVLEKTLYNLRITYEGKGLYLKDFNGQLERSETGSPFWNICLETNIVTTKRFMAKVFSSEFLENNNNNNNNRIDERLKVYSLSKLEKPNREELFSIKNSDFFPGFFNRSFIQYKELSEREEVKELLKVRD